MVSQVPFEPMHLLYLGVMKKCFEAWIDGKFSKLSKLPVHSLEIASSRLETLKHYCPRDFAKRPRGLRDYKRFKATENRQFLLYTGIVVMYGVLDKDVYLHFVLLHAAIRSLTYKRSSQNFYFAHLVLRTYVEKCEAIYGMAFFSYNIHGLLHVVGDAKRFGSFDAYSAFPYENNMLIFRKYCRKPDLPLQQIANRRVEKIMHVNLGLSTMHLLKLNFWADTKQSLFLVKFLITVVNNFRGQKLINGYSLDKYQIIVVSYEMQ
ncbi:uncharacterized protein LOC116852650 [Odontomachus brunneus]|uniref:uncharacterized protein LOC116852650 n=1 Tax=Odontomachus brunneus TaxID=486640 RepID=UPI0013F278CE|nr:uncharacterized protein LOC116852650 [Odontomachus brunneus]